MPYIYKIYNSSKFQSYKESMDVWITVTTCTQSGITGQSLKMFESLALQVDSVAWQDNHSIVPRRHCLLQDRMYHLVNISYTESYRNLQQSYRTVQLCYRNRKFKLEYSMSAPVRSSIHWNGTYPTPKTFYRFFTIGVDLCGWRLNCPEDIQLSYWEMWKWRKLGAGEPAAMRTEWEASRCNGQLQTIILMSSALPCAPFLAQDGAKDGHFQQTRSSVRKL